MEKQTLTRKIPFCVISSHKDAEMANQARAPCSDLLLPKLSLFFSSLASSLILDLETNLDSNSVSFDVPAGRVVSGGRGKHPVYKTVRKKILKISLAPTDFKREELIRMWSPSASFIFYFSFFFFPQEESPMCHVSCNTGYIHHR